MKINEISKLPPKRYSPKGSVKWDIDHPRFKYYPEVQDFIMETMNDLPKEINDQILKKYNCENKSIIWMLTQEATFQLEQDIRTYLETGIFP